jgi:hypothetical protein
MNTPEIISLSEISTSDNKDNIINITNVDNLSKTPKSVNFGPGADLFMNPGKVNKQNSPRSNINLGNLDELGLDNPTPSDNIEKISLSRETGIKININDLSPNTVKINPDKIDLGSSTVKQENKETWDGFKTFNDIPVDPDKKEPEKPKKTTEEILRLKFSFIRKLEAMDKQGITVSRRYTMDDKLEEMQGEYEMIKNEISKKNSVKFQSKMLMAFVSGIEFLNNRFDPFDIKLDGWGESINENVTEYDEVFGELHEKYGSKAKMAPEIKMLFMLGGSAAMIHMTNTMFKSAMPGMDDIMKQNPDLMQQFTQAAANSMSQQSPGFGNFMSNMMPNQGNGGTMPPMGSPPAPPSTNSYDRPDINMARGGGGGRGADRGGGGRGGGYNPMSSLSPPPSPSPNRRTEMRGPSDISDLLSGIKTKSINIKSSTKKDDGSTISVSELKEMQKDDIQRKSKRRVKSERNTVNLSL